MAKYLVKSVFVLLWCIVFFLPLVSFSPADADSDGWVELLGTASSDVGRGVGVDTSGNIYVTGYTDGNLGGSTNAGEDDIFVWKRSDRSFRVKHRKQL